MGLHRDFLEINDWSFLFVTLPGAKILKNRVCLKIHDLSFLFVTLPGPKILKNRVFLYLKVFQRTPKTSFGAQKRYFLKDLSFGTMLELLVLKSPIQRTSQRVKWTSGARDLTISFQ